MKKIKVSGKFRTQDYALVDDNMFDYLNQFSWYIKNSPTSQYVVAHIPIGLKVNFKVINTYGGSNGKGIRKTYMHWIVLSPTEELMVDHINRDIYNNRRENLKIITRGENRKNAKDRIVLGL